jgi:cell division protein FtsA
MARNIITGIDIGTHQIKVVVAENVREKDRSYPRVIGAGIAESRGLRHGYVTNITDVAKSIRTAVAQAENISKVKVKRAFISVGGIGLGSYTSTGATIISRADSEISELDTKKVQDTARTEIPTSLSLNKKVIHEIPLQYKIDGKPVLGKPEGLKASRLEIKTLFVTCLEHHLNDLISAVEEAGIEVEDVMAAPIAASLVTLSKSQKIAGCVLANIGAETVSIVVFENNMPISLEVFPIGSTDITNDIALGLKVSLEEAEQIKLGGSTGVTYPRKKLEEIITARLSDVFELIEAHLKKIGRNGLLPAGIIITGGGSGAQSIEDLAKAALKLPSRIGTITLAENTKETIKDSTWTVAYGLCIWGITADEGPRSSNIKFIAPLKRNLISWFKQFLP